MILVDLRAAHLVCSSSKAHTIRHVLALIDYVALEALVTTHGLVQNLLYVHATAHLLLLINGTILYLAALVTILGHLIKNVLDSTQFRTR